VLKYNIKYFETSAKVKHNIKEVFIAIAQDILQLKESLKNQNETLLESVQSTGRKTLLNKAPQTKEEKPCCS